MSNTKLADGKPTDTPEVSARRAGEFFDQYAETWDSFYTDSTQQSRAFDFINRQIQLLKLLDSHVPPTSRLLEFGCGAGHTALRMAESGHAMNCLDVSPQMIEAARNTFAQGGQNAKFHVGQLSDVRPDGSELFDAAIGMGVMEYIADHDATLRQLHRLLKPGGVCLLSFPNALSPLRQFERVAKRSMAFVLAAITGSQRYWDIALRPSKLHLPGRIRRTLATAQFEERECRYLTFGIRVGGFWLPPLRLVRRLDHMLANSPLRWLGRNYILVARKVR